MEPKERPKPDLSALRIQREDDEGSGTRRGLRVVLLGTVLIVVAGALLIKRLNEEFHKTIIIVTHDPQAASHAHAVLHLEKGLLSKSGGVYEVPAAHH